MIKKSCLVISILFFSHFIQAKEGEGDSLLSIVAQHAVDSNNVNALIRLSAIYRESSIDTALKYAEAARAMAEQINFPKGMGYALKSIGLSYNQTGDYVNALQAWLKALEIFEKNGIKVGSANMLSNIGVIYYNKGDETKALDYYLRSLKIAEEIRDTLRITTALVNIGGVYSNKPATIPKAMEFQIKALNYGLALKDSSLIGASNMNIGELFNSMYQKDTLKNNYLDSALVYLLRGSQFSIHTKDLPYALNQIGMTYKLKRQYADGIRYYEMGYKSGEEYGSKLDMGQALLGIAEIYRCLQDYEKAIRTYQKAEDLFNSIGLEESYDIVHVYSGLAQAYSALHKSDSAYFYQQKLIVIKDKIYDLEVDKKLSTKLFAFEMDKKQAELDLKEQVIGRQKLVRNVLMGGLAVMLLFASIFFFQRNRIKKGKKLSDELLLNILPEEIAEELKAKGSAQAQSIDHVTVLFTDFKGFTAISEQLSPEALVKDLNECFSAFDHIMAKYNMEKIKTIGDSYMAAGGLPTANKTHAEDAIKAALEIRDFIEAGQADKLAKGLPYFEIRIGIHTGPVVAGIVGVKKFAYDIWGDTVNTASRMESSGEVGQVNISETTYELVKDKYKCTSRGKIQAKGKGEIEMYFVEGKI